jgi:hypothetical protein
MKFLGVQELVVVYCFEFLTPLLWGGHNFFIFNLFLMILNASNAPRGGVQRLLTHLKQKSPTLGSGLPKAFNCIKISLVTLMKVFF